MLELYPWQKPLANSVEAGLRKHRFMICGLPTGSGKTIIALDVAQRLSRPTVVVAPKVSLTQWRRAAEGVGCAGVLAGIINPERISTPRGCEFYTRDRKWTLPPQALVIFDEPHRSASGVKGVTTQALAELKAYGVSLLALTATLADSPLKLRALGWWAGLHQYNKDSFYGWCRRHGCEDVDVGYGSGSAGRSVFRFTRNKVVGQAIMAHIRRDLGDRFMSIKAEDIPGFPTESVEVELLDLGRREREEIDRAWADMSERMRGAAASAMAEMGRERERAEYVMAEAVAERAAALVEDGDSAAVFFNYTEPRLRFEAAFEKLAGFAPASVYGGQREADRQAGIDAFQANACHCISVMAEAGGAALSLHDERKERPRTSLILPGWNAATVKQILGRIRRCNGTHATQIFVLAAGTVQERVAASLKRKLACIDALNDGDLMP